MISLVTSLPLDLPSLPRAPVRALCSRSPPLAGVRPLALSAPHAHAHASQAELQQALDETADERAELEALRKSCARDDARAAEVAQARQTPFDSPRFVGTYSSLPLVLERSNCGC